MWLSRGMTAVMPLARGFTPARTAERTGLRDHVGTPHRYDEGHASAGPIFSFRNWVTSTNLLAPLVHAPSPHHGDPDQAQGEERGGGGFGYKGHCTSRSDIICERIDHVPAEVETTDV